MAKTTIYWTVVSDFPNHSLLDLELKPLISNLSKDKSDLKGNLFSCSSFINKYRNTFYNIIPFDINVSFQNDQMFSNKNEIIQTPASFKNSFAFNLNVQTAFFCEEPQLMETSPAYLHNTSYAKYGFNPSGAFDIGNWFRTFSPGFELWENVHNFIAKEGEPHLYFNFPNKNKIEFKKFYLNEKLLEILESSSNHRRYVPKQNLNNLYDRFIRSGQKKIILKEIKNNLI